MMIDQAMVARLTQARRRPRGWFVGSCSASIVVICLLPVQPLSTHPRGLHANLAFL